MPRLSSISLLTTAFLCLLNLFTNSCSLENKVGKHRSALDDTARLLAINLVQQGEILQTWAKVQSPFKVNVYVGDPRLRRECGRKFATETQRFADLVAYPSFPIVQTSDALTQMTLLITSEPEAASYVAQWRSAHGAELTMLYSHWDRVTDDELIILGSQKQIYAAIGVIRTTPERLPLFTGCRLEVRYWLSILLLQDLGDEAWRLAESQTDFDPAEIGTRIVSLVFAAMQRDIQAGRSVTSQSVLSALRPSR